MNTGPPGRSRQLALRTVLVLAAHLALLRPARLTLAPESATRIAQFRTRMIAPVPLPVAAPAQELPAVAAIAPLAPTRPPPVPPPAAARPSQRRVSPAVPAPAAAPPHTQALPASIAALPSAVLHYEVSTQSRGVHAQGTARLDWRQDGEHYEARLELTAAGLRPRVQQSTGAFSVSGLLPERFSDKTRSEQATHFDHAGGRVVFSNNQPEAVLRTGMQDRLSVLLQLAMLAAASPERFTPGTELAIPTATTHDADEWIFRVVGEEELLLPGGSVRALKLEHLPRKEFDQRVELWIAPGQAYAPVRLRLTNPDGGWVDQRWSSTDKG
jgi:hypothetical protein